MDATDNLRLPYIAAAQAQKHVTHNEALRTLDALVHLTVLDKDLNTPPASPAAGDRYIVGASPTDAWSGEGGNIAAWQDGAWAFHAPREGWLAWVADEARLYAWWATAWAPLPTVLNNGAGILDGAGNAQLVFHATPDAANHLAVTNAAPGTSPTLSAEGTDPDIDLRLAAKGTGVVRSTGQMAVSSAVFPPLRVERNTASTNNILSAQQMLISSSGDVVDGFGVNLNFAIRDDDAAINEIGSLAFVRSGSDNSGRFQIQPYNAGISTTRFEIGPIGNVYFPGIGTTASAANAVVNNGSSPANELLRSTSSLRYKTDVRDLTAEWKRVVKGLRPITYRSTASADDPALHWYGLIAEEVSEVEPRLVSYVNDANGKKVPESVQYERLAVLLLKAVQELLATQNSGLP